MRTAKSTRMESTGRSPFAMAALSCIYIVALLATPAWSHDVQPHPHSEGSKAIDSSVPADDVCRKTGGRCDVDHNRPEHGSLGNIGAKLADPTSDLWAMSTSFNAPAFYDGNVNQGNSKVGGAVAIQPVMPIPLYGEGEDQWKLITRPVIPVIFSEPIPTGPDKFKHRGGLGDIQLSTLLVPSASLMKKVAPPVGSWIFGVGPQWYIPTSTNDNLGKNQFGIGPGAVLGYKNKSLTAVTLTSWTFGIGGRGDRGSHARVGGKPNLSQLSLLYALIFNLPDAWQVGFNPTISYNDKATSKNKWNVPVGLFAGRTIKVGRVPVNIRVGAEYSVVNQNDFGQRAQFRIQIEPVIPGLIQKPIFGGR